MNDEQDKRLERLEQQMYENDILTNKCWTGLKLYTKQLVELEKVVSGIEFIKSKEDDHDVH